jgi:hypothetical protein
MPYTEKDRARDIETNYYVKSLSKTVEDHETRIRGHEKQIFKLYSFNGLLSVLAASVTAWIAK